MSIEFTHLFIHLKSKNKSNAYYVPGTVVGPGDGAVYRGLKGSNK